MSADFDSPWKDALEKFFRPLVELCFPAISASIDWSEAPKFLDTELHELLRGATLGRQHVDKLAEVRLVDGDVGLILLHVEVQHHPEQDFAKRLYSYHRRLEEKGPVVTVAILADTSRSWRSGHYENELLGCRVQFDFPVCKLLDLLARREELEASSNPAAVLVLANWAAQQTGHDAPERYRWKRRLLRSAIEKGFQREDIAELYYFIDWLLQLPEPLEKEFRSDILRNEEKLMPYVSSFERYAREEGHQEGAASAIREMVKDTLLVRFGKVTDELIARLDAERDLERLRSMHHLALTVQNADQFLSQAF